MPTFDEIDTANPTAGPRWARGARPWLSWFLGALLLASLGLNGLQLLAAKERAERGFDEVLLDGDAGSKAKVLSISLHGMIMESHGSADMVAALRRQLRQARKDKDVRSILLEVDSPGGGITASDILYHELAAYHKGTGVPIVALCRSLTASGGYYACMAADHIVAHETSMVGSIGVIAQLPSFKGLMDRVGIQMNVIKSTRWDGSESFKDIGSPYRAMKPEERRFMQGEIRRMWERFVDVVATGRKGRLTRPQVARIADGRVWTGREALALKLIDSVGYREDAWHRAQELGKAPDARLVTWRAQGSLLGELLGARAPWTALETSLQETAAPVATSSPRLMYLWTGL